MHTYVRRNVSQQYENYGENSRQRERERERDREMLPIADNGIGNLINTAMSAYTGIS